MALAPSGSGQSRFLMPPLPEIRHLVQSHPRVSELTLVNDQPRVRLALFDVS